MRRSLISFSVLLVLLASCGGQKAGGSEEDSADSLMADTLAVQADTMPRAADELFDDFIFNFTANRKLQMERVAFPLPVVDGTHQQTISRGQWKMERFFMQQDYYTLLFDSEAHMEVVKDTTVSHAIVEKIYFDKQSVRQYVFDRRQGIWMLTRIQTRPISEMSNATFLNFYHQFATDKAFQQSHLAASVQFVGPDPDDDFSQMEGIITPDTWEAFAPELPSTMIYNIIYGEPTKEGNTMIFLLRGIANGLEMDMTFRRIGDKWKLTKLTT